MAEHHWGDEGCIFIQRVDKKYFVNLKMCPQSDVFDRTFTGSERTVLHSGVFLLK